MSEFYTPSPEEFRRGALQEFAYLTSEYGFEECKAPVEYANPYSAFFRRSRRFVFVEGLSYGFSLGVSLGRLSLWSRMKEQLPLSIYILLREPKLLDPRYPNTRGQLEEMKFAATALKRCAADFLAGDLSIFPQALHLQAERERASRETDKETEIKRTFMRASDAFHSGKFDLVVKLLEPQSSHFGEAQKAMLCLAKKRVEAGR